MEEIKKGKYIFIEKKLSKDEINILIPCPERAIYSLTQPVRVWGDKVYVITKP